MNFWHEIYRAYKPGATMNMERFTNDLYWCLGFIAAFAVGTAIVFSRRDIHS